jgi:hypothetical protein
MKKWLALISLFFLASPAYAVDIADLIARETTTLTLSTSPADMETPISQRGDYLRLNCTVACYVAIMPVSSTTALKSSPFMYLPANETAYHKSPGNQVVVGLGTDTGVLTITIMSP